VARPIFTYVSSPRDIRFFTVLTDTHNTWAASSIVRRWALPVRPAVR
jgi:hypothetical protein